MQAFADISESLRADRYIAPHFRYYIREVRVVAYSQVRHLALLDAKPNCEHGAGKVCCLSENAAAQMSAVKDIKALLSIFLTLYCNYCLGMWAAF